MVTQYDRHLTAAGHQVTIFTLGKPAPGEQPSKVVRSPAIPLGKTGYGFALGYSREAQSRLRQVDVIHCHHLLMGLEFAQRYGRKPVVFTNHTRYDLYLSAYARLPYRLVDPIMRFAWPRMTDQADIVVAPSAYILSILRRSGVRVPIELIENGIEVTRFQSPSRYYSRSDLGIPTEATLLTYVGRLSPEKNVRYLINEFQLAATSTDDLHLLFVGDGPLRAQLERQVTIMGLVNRVHFAGQVSPEVVPDLLTISDVFVSASLSEVHPLTVIEAQVAGLPVIAIDSPGIGEIVINERTGLMVDKSRGSLAEAIRFLSGRAADRQDMGARARKHGARYDIRVTVEQTLSLYQRLLASEKREKRYVTDGTGTLRVPRPAPKPGRYQLKEPAQAFREGANE